MRIDNLGKVILVRGEARIPDVLNAEPALTPCHRPPDSWQVTGSGCVQRLWLPLACPAFLGSQWLCFRCSLPAALPLPPPTTTSRALLEGSS